MLTNKQFLEVKKNKNLLGNFPVKKIQNLSIKRKSYMKYKNNRTNETGTALYSLSSSQRAKITGIPKDEIAYFDGLDNHTRQRFTLETANSILFELLQRTYGLNEVKNVPTIREGLPTYREMIAEQIKAILACGKMLESLTNEDYTFNITQFETRPMSQDEIEDILFIHPELAQPTISNLLGIAEWLLRFPMFIKYVIDNDSFFQKHFYDVCVDVVTLRQILVYELYKAKMEKARNN
jgi:hypothetical protein